MSKEREIAETYRLRAQELRALADLDQKVKTRDTLMGVAKAYDRMALTLEDIAATNENVRRPVHSNAV